jgi:hypothetical protein
MTNLYSVIKKLEEFDGNFRRPGFGDISDVFRSIDLKNADWADLWSANGELRVVADSACVYIFFDQNDELLYVGRADIFGNRIGGHFQRKNSRWRGEVARIGVIPVPPESWFEIYAIEAYLIRELQPKGNKVGK